MSSRNPIQLKRKAVRKAVKKTKSFPRSCWCEPAPNPASPSPREPSSKSSYSSKIHENICRCRQIIIKIFVIGIKEFRWGISKGQIVTECAFWIKYLKSLSIDFYCLIKIYFSSHTRYCCFVRERSQPLLSFLCCLASLHKLSFGSLCLR